MVSVIYDDSKKLDVEFVSFSMDLGLWGSCSAGRMKQFSMNQIFLGIGIAMFILIDCCLFITYPDHSETRVPNIGRFKLLRAGIYWCFRLFFTFSVVWRVVNDWTVFYLTGFGFLEHSKALLTITVMTASLTAARLLLVALLKKFSQPKILVTSVVVAIAGVLFMIQPDYVTSLIGMMLVGFGIASTFPIILGIVGAKFPTMSGTAFSIALVFSLVGNNVMNSVTGLWLGKSGAFVYPLILITCFTVIIVLFTRVSKTTSHY